MHTLIFCTVFAIVCNIGVMLFAFNPEKKVVTATLLGVELILLLINFIFVANL